MSDFCTYSESIAYFFFIHMLCITSVDGLKHWRYTDSCVPWSPLAAGSGLHEPPKFVVSLWVLILRPQTISQKFNAIWSEIPSLSSGWLLDPWPAKIAGTWICRPLRLTLQLLLLIVRPLILFSCASSEKFFSIQRYSLRIGSATRQNRVRNRI